MEGLVLSGGSGGEFIPLPLEASGAAGILGLWPSSVSIAAGAVSPLALLIGILVTALGPLDNPG